MPLSRRDFFRIGAAAGLGGVVGAPRSLRARELAMGGAGFSAATGEPLAAIPSSCWQCVARDGIVGYVEDGRLRKIEGHPDLPRTNGKLCARGQAGVNQVYDPDRLLYPLQRVGARGQGRWKRLRWEEALELLVNGGAIAGRRVKGLATLRREGRPERFMFHYGRMHGSDAAIILDYFLPAYGTGTIGNHTSLGQSAKWVAHELTWGTHYDAWDVEKARLMLNFGSNCLEAHTNAVPVAQRLVGALARGAKLYTFDVRLSNTAAKSTEWIPIRPGTDLAVVLAMANVLMQINLYDESFIKRFTNATVPELKQHLSRYTPRWAEGISGVPAEKIESLIRAYGNTAPRLVLSGRGAVAHYNGVQTERAIMMLDALGGNIDVRGGRCRAVRAEWTYPFPKPEGETRKLEIVDGERGAYAYPTHHVSHQVLDRIDEGPARPEIYMIYCYNPAYANGDCRETLRILKNEAKIPFLVAVDVALSESTELADLVLPDATYLERWACDDMVCPSQIPEFYIRQPMHAPLGEARNFPDVACELARRMGFDLGFASAQEFVAAACDNTPGVQEAGGFAYMRKHGAWWDKQAKPRYWSHNEQVDVSGAILDPATGVYHEKRERDGDFASLDAREAARRYVAQECGDGVPRKAFPPDARRWKTGLFEIKSEALAEKGFDPLPAWMPIPEHQAMGPDELVLITFKAAVQTNSRTQNCKWLTELYHGNPAWIHPRTAAARGIGDRDTIRVTSRVGTLLTRARLTEAIHPGAIAISSHCGHWAYGLYASLGKSAVYRGGPGVEPPWWMDKGAHPNWVIPNAGDPICGQQRWMDTVVSVEKA